jgi:serine/threonine-protein kinase
MADIPAQLGKYRITELLGEGAMGVVYKAFDPDIRRTVALKTVRAALAGDEGPGSIADRFRNEAHAAGRLSHPGIVAVYDFGHDQGLAYIAMEYVEGRSLGQLLTAKVQFQDEDIPGLMSQLLDALGHAHAMGVWHRDVKPANIILARGGRLKVADFGIARIEDVNLTQTRLMVGTPSHMAPEQYLGLPIDRRIDLYAAGVVLYQLLTGLPPFTGGAESLMYRVVHEPVRLPSAVEGCTRPRWYDAIVARALAKQPADRFDSAAQFKQALADALGHAIDDTAWERTVVRAWPRPAAPAPGPALASASASAAQALATPGAAALSLPGHWDPLLLAQAEASLTPHVGPLAAVLVRRAARDCSDLPSLYARLAEQVEDQGARTALLNASLLAKPSTLAGTRGSGITAATTAGSAAVADRALDAAWLAHAERVLVEHMGPIARLMVQRAAARTTQRGAFVATLVDGISDPMARSAVLARLTADLKL